MSALAPAQKKILDALETAEDALRVADAALVAVCGDADCVLRPHAVAVFDRYLAVKHTRQVTCRRFGVVFLNRGALGLSPNR